MLGNDRDSMARLKERENCILRLCYKETEGKTKKQIEAERRKNMHQSNMKKFGKVTIGVHGKELP